MSLKIETVSKRNITNNPMEISECVKKPSNGVKSKLDGIVNSVMSSNNRNDAGRNPDLQSARKINRKSIERAQSMKYARRRSYKQDKGKPGKDTIELPTKFLLGGNINDPLNLNSMNDAEVNRLLNAVTPSNSPLPTPAHRQNVEVILPPNIQDPLNLNSGEDVDMKIARQRLSAKKRKKNKRRKSFVGDNNDNLVCDDTEIIEDGEKDLSIPLSVDTEGLGSNKICREVGTGLHNKLKKDVNEIVSPAIPQHSPRSKRKRTISEGSKKHEMDGATRSKQARQDSQTNKFKKQPSRQRVDHQQNKKRKDTKFCYGNYDRYYGKRNHSDKDDRLNHFKKEWFQGKDVLDIGCNIGHISLSIAKDFEPKNVVGMDIDGKLISIARKNVKHYLSKDVLGGKPIPVSLSQTHGPAVPTAIPDECSHPKFPDNINFVQGNYVLDRDELLDLQKEEYDVILALSITKWLQLNFGDDGLKRCFKRMFHQLRPGGKLILEPQAFSTYKKRKNINETILKNFKAIQLKPEAYTRYLMSQEVGFMRYDRIQTPFNKAKGFQRPMFVYTKPDSNQTTPYDVTESRGVTPLMNIDCGYTYTPAFHPYSTPPVYDGITFSMDYNRTPQYQNTPQWEHEMSESQGQSQRDTLSDYEPHTDEIPLSHSDNMHSSMPCSPEINMQQEVNDDHSVSNISATNAPSPEPLASGSQSSITQYVEHTTSLMVSTGNVSPNASQSSSSSCDSCCSGSSVASAELGHTPKVRDVDVDEKAGMQPVSDQTSEIVKRTF